MCNGDLFTVTYSLGQIYPIIQVQNRQEPHPIPQRVSRTRERDIRVLHDYIVTDLKTIYF